MKASRCASESERRRETARTVCGHARCERGERGEQDGNRKGASSHALPGTRGGCFVACAYFDSRVHYTRPATRTAASHPQREEPARERGSGEHALEALHDRLLPCTPMCRSHEQ
eukprot:2312105-Rhodomonas_salina.3